jgi:hypothetical protein
MIKARRQVLRSIAEVDGEVVDTINGSCKRVDVVIHGVGILWLLLLLGSSSFFFHFIIFFWHFSVGLVLLYLHIIMHATILDRG